MSCLIDTHCHLDNECYQDDLQEVILRAQQNGVKKFIIPGADPKDLDNAIKITQVYPNVYFALGIHPYEIHNNRLVDIEHFVTDKKCVAIGECGLDYYRLPELEERNEYKKAQKEMFIAHIELALKLNLPLIVHIREASNDAFEILNSYKNLKGVLHCFNADEILLGLADRFYYGIGGVSTFKNARKIVEILPKIPKNRILLETDAPYLTPHPHRGQRNEPSYISLIVTKLSEVLGMDTLDIEDLSTKNAYDLFGQL
ncbi:TatD family hydrolase [Helicobacter cappadocius]|uniref:TatD family hydrolase n=1 Tax=Helicobacter cappadocius TaxID=3063998 RepID=A0AA90T571_9HELI|nr:MULTISPECIES: TatD family hydrolase [unclassified Helicobacter]MDO7253184.1 TatD family hydrolase [Helicobacter sp. faydin-H75]MDP2539108.1 TatD family hydrolase [Helicobacter sp. faydin-H76]